jgi:hypothetical protein
MKDYTIKTLEDLQDELKTVNSLIESNLNLNLSGRVKYYRKRAAQIKKQINDAEMRELNRKILQQKGLI